MHRYLTALIVLLGLAAFVGQTQAQTLQPVSGYLSAGKTKVFFPRTPGNSATDTIYEIAGNYDVAGTLQIMEGAEVWFLPNSRIIDSTGGKIIANGFTGFNRRILFRGMPISDTSHEWGHFLILPNSDSAFFANVRFVNFRKRNTVDQTLLYSPSLDPTDAAFDAAMNNAFNGNGGVIATMSRKTYIYDAIVDSCQTSFRGGAFAFLQSPVGFTPADDGRLALANGQVCRLTIRDTRAYNNEVAPLPTDAMALGGAIYMASNGSSFNSANFITATLGYTPFSVGTTSFTATMNTMLFERCTANNTLGPTSGTSPNFAKGGAIYVGSNTALTIANCTFNNDSAIANTDANTWGGAIAVSATSGNPSQVPSGPGANGNDRLPGLTILKMATFAGNVAGKGGAINLDFLYGSSPALAPRLNIDAEHIVPFMPGFVGPVRDSGLVQFNGNVAYLVGGAIYSPNQVFITGYLAPQNFPWPGGIDSVELRVRFFNNLAGEGGGSIYLDGFAGGAPDLQERRALHLQNSVNPFDARLNPTGGPNRGNLYGMTVQGGGAEFVGMRDSSFAVEYNSNTVVGGNGGAVAIVDAISINGTANNRFFAENEYNAQNVKIARDTAATPFPYDPRELTRFLDNRVILGPDSAQLYNYSNGVAHGRGGGIFIQITTPPDNPLIPLDSTFFSRVRFEGNEAYSGSAIWSDRYDLKLMSNQCLIANNHASSQSSLHVDLDASGISNPGDVNAGATIWADFEGSLPSYETNSRGDAIYDNTARYILRLPVSPIVGRSGADTLRGNFWGETGPSVITEIHPPTGPQQATFFIDYYKGCFTNVYEPNRNPPAGYTPVQIGTIPDTLLMEGRVYDLFDKGTDMKVADYAFRRLAPAEAFSLGIPNDVVKLHRFTRNIFDTNATYVQKIDLNQTDFVGPHPIGYPLFLQADVSAADSNRDAYARNYTVFMVFNQNTNEFVRVNLKETMVDEGNGPQQTYQGRLDFVPDSSIAKRHANFRQQTLYTLSLLRPSQMTFDEVQRASMLEDSAALAGREYQLSLADMQGTTSGDTVCTQGVTGTTTWYAGERYHTLPVRPGDHILVISRTHLWKYGAAYAITHGLQFTIGDVLPPSFVADITNLQNDPYNPNVRFVHEDVNYDASDPAHTLFRVAGYDPNNFYDPRFLFNQGNYTQLALSVTPDLIAGEAVPANAQGQYLADTLRALQAHIRLNHWLKATTIFNQNITGSNGYILLTGQPHNPDVVPGGEALTVTATNFPPNFASERGLLNAFPGLLGPDSASLSMWTFPPYMNCTTGGFLSDTLCVRSTSSTYHFRIIVMDSLPRFLNVDQRPCAANLTDSLRYSFDLQTDDELEDSAAAAEMIPTAKDTGRTMSPAWDFRFGRTNYSFPTRPSWMVYPSGGNYVPVDSSAAFQQRGIINVRIDSATAVGLLTPTPQVNGELNLDTIAAVQAHDGHTGKALQRWPVPVNFAPTIITTALPNAKEGVDYSLNFQDPQKINRIAITDPNVADYHTYTLLYQGQSKVVYRDGLYKVGRDSLVGHTPSWLKIDPFSGVLTGIPGITDAPRFAGVCGDSVQVTVIVSDQCQLTTWKTFNIAVDSVAHLPSFFRGPGQLCVMNHQQFCDSVKVSDLDLLRDTCAKETLTVVSLDPRITVTPGTINGQLKNDTITLQVCGHYDEDNTYFFNNPPAPEYIRLKVTDATGNVDTLTYAVHVGNTPKFECAITVSNAVTQLHPLQDAQILCFGAGPFGHDSLDIQYCEYEVAPAPPTSAFDARWILPLGGKLEGTTVDVRSDTNQSSLITWQVVFQAGNESGGAGSLYPIEICWKPSCLDPKNLTTPFNTGRFMLRNPRNRGEFDINMFSGARIIDNSLYTWRSMGSDSMCLEIRDQGLTNALIVFVPAGAGVGDQGQKPTFALEPNYPNPFASATTLNFAVAERSNVRIDIYDLKGTLVRTLVNEQLDPGSYPVTWDGTDASGATVPEGSYIAHMTAGSFTSSVKMSFEKVAK